LTTLLLTRHGHVEGIHPERFRGRAELPLTELGVRQAQAVARLIAASWEPAAIYTSPMGRCIATGQEIARACGADATVLEELNDLDYGDWQGQTHEAVRAHSPYSFELWRRTPHLMRFPGGELLQDLVARIDEALRFALRRHSSETVVFVGHNSGNRALLLKLLDQPLSAYCRLQRRSRAIHPPTKRTRPGRTFEGETLIDSPACSCVPSAAVSVVPCGRGPRIGAVRIDDAETRRNLCVEQPNPVPMQERKEILRLLIGDKEFDFHCKGAGKLEEVTFVQDVMPSEAGHSLEG